MITGTSTATEPGTHDRQVISDRLGALGIAEWNKRRRAGERWSLSRSWSMKTTYHRSLKNCEQALRGEKETRN